MLNISSSFNIKRIKRKLKERFNTNLRLDVGFFDTAKYPNGIYVSQVAYWNEYGTTLSPPRPFFRNAIKENSVKWLELFRDTNQQTKDMVKSLGIVGTEARSDIMDSITDLSSPPNSDITINGLKVFNKEGKLIFEIKGKGSNNPLINTGFMRDSVAYEIKGKAK